MLPLAWLYAGVMAVRNWLYDKGLKKSAVHPVPIISLGNLRVGGTGKTPHVAWLIARLQEQGETPAILSRGYGRETKGFVLAGPAATAATIGDEPLQYYHDFRGAVPVAVAENRNLGIRSLLAAHPELSVVVLDDAFQHRRVRPSFSILLTEQQRPFYEDHVLPAGRLRESRGGARRADAVIVTKCEATLTEEHRRAITRQVRRYARPGAPVLFSMYHYLAPVPLGRQAVPTGKDAILLTGIAQPGPLRAELEAGGYRITHHAAFPDHHAFTAAELAAVAGQLQAGQSVFTTRKDAMRLLEPPLREQVAALPIFYIPIEVGFLAGGDAHLLQLLNPLIQPTAVV
ncbi:tetraacyldisaccharide 4'-kinase [Hymenobacter translucens]|uniref:tetraacyldisaccharide 4'-kinase n=1 Tax=Hymenobacter translucens TaxID=2886507 RepID=UPI0021D46FD4|nr:tetraacyldisaccharide 4'-kinase [Hymenobacter translucens]